MEKAIPKTDNSLLTLEELFKVVGDQLNARDVRVLKFMFSGIFTPEFLNQIHDGFSFLQALEKIDKVDESNFKNVENYLRLLNRHDLFQFLTLRRRQPVRSDPVNNFLEQQASSQKHSASSSRRKCENCNGDLSADDVSSSQGSSNQLQDNQQSANQLLEDNSDAIADKHDVSCSEECLEGPSDEHSTEPTSGGKPKLQRECSGDNFEQSGDNQESSSQCSSVKGVDGLCKKRRSSASCLSSDSRTEDCSPSGAKRSRMSLKRKASRRSERLKRVSLPGSVAAVCPAESSVSEGDVQSGAGGGQGSGTRGESGSCDVAPDSGTPAGTTTGEGPTPPLGEALPSADKPAEDDIKKKITCDIRLRVRAEYCSHATALQGQVHSNKPELIERQFEKFMQANTILKSRDLGSIICDIKFSELTYLDAFWRDYINGSLLEALKGVFITEPLKQAVGHEAIKLVVNVDEDDYEKGRLELLKNLKHDSGAPDAFSFII